MSMFCVNESHAEDMREQQPNVSDAARSPGAEPESISTRSGIKQRDFLFPDI